jgi:glycosyltransferase involved in cell wall biosynthesis
MAATGPVRVAYLIGSASIGGTERHLLELLRELDRRRFDPLVICINPGGALREALRALNVTILDLGMRRSYSVLGMSRLLRLVLELRRRRVQILHAYQFHGNLYASLVAPLAGVRTLLVSERGKGYGGWHRRLARRFYCWRAHRILVNCDALRTYVRESGPFEGKILTIPNGVDREKLRAGGGGRETRSRLGIPDSARLIGSVGRLQPVKGHRHLVDAFVPVAAACPEAYLLLVGGGPEEAALRERMAEATLDHRVRFIGFQTDVQPYLGAIDLFVLPSLSEAHSMALLEAVAMGKPVIATAVGGNGETVQTEVNGLLVPPGSPEALRDALLRLLTEPGLAERLGRGALESSARYDLRDMVGRYELLYSEVAAGDAGRGGQA